MKSLIKTNNRTWKLTIVAVLIVTFLCSNVAFTLPAHAATKFSVKATGVTLREGQKLTKAMAAKTVKVTKTGKKVSQYTVTQIGKKVTPNKNGKYKLTIKVGTVKKNVSVKVNKIKKVYIKQTKLTGLVEGSKFSSSNFMKKTTVMAEYKKGSDKKLSTYTISAAKTVKANSKGEFVVTVKYGKLKDKISIPVIKKCVTETPATEVPATAEPTAVPTTAPAITTEVPATVVPTVVPTTAPAVTTEVPATAEPTAVPTTAPVITTEVPATAEPTAVPTTAEPTAEPTAVPTTAPEVTTEVPATAPVATTEVPATEPPVYIYVPVTVTPTPVPGVKEYTLTINSNGGNVKVNSRSTSGTEKVAEGTTISLTATDTSDYRFVRWVDNSGKEISTSKTCEVTVNSDTSISAVFENVYTLTVNRVGGKGKVTIAGESLDFYSNIASYTDVPGRYKLVAVSTDDYNFVSWTDDSGKVISTDAEYTISLVSDATVTANFAEAEKTVTVTYQHESGDIIASESVAFGEVLATPTTNVWRADKTFAGWKVNETVYEGVYSDNEFYANGNKLSDAIKELTAAKQDVIITSYYVANPIQTYTVSLNGGTFKDGNTTATVEANTHVYLVAETPEGKVFSYWQDADGNIVSYYEDYDFLVTKDITLTAVYADEPVEVKPVVTLDAATVDEANYGISYSISCQIPSSYEKLEWGILISTKLSGDSITYDSGAKILKETIYATELNVSNGGYDLTLSPSYFENHKTIEARAYCIIQNDEGTQIIYSANTISITL